MKFIAVEISVEHVPSLEPGPGRGLSEEFTLALNEEIEDDEPAGPFIEKALLELHRRYRNLNARKTN